MKTKIIKVAICYNPKHISHSGSWANSWIEYCRKHEIDLELLDGTKNDIIPKLRDFTCLLWHFTGFSFTHMLVARNMLYSAKAMGLKVFPDFNEAWHFDDKIAENFLLESVNASIPPWHVFFNPDEAVKWIKEDANFPLVAKLRKGSGSQNVRLIKDRKEGVHYCRKMFGGGYNFAPSIAFKASSNIKSTRTIGVFYSRIKRIPEFIRMRKNAKEFPNERGYVLFQGYVPNNGFDLKIVVVGDKLSYVGRNIRKNDFRASGGGDLFYDRGLVSKEIIDMAFGISDRLGFQCMGYDFVIDKYSNDGKIVEISYGFSNSAILGAGGYFDRAGNWHNEPLNAPHEVLSNLLRYR